MSAEIPTEWYFITPPQSVSWSKGSKMNVIEPYGTNNPYVNYGTTKLRQLSLGNAMLEGFSDGGKVVEDNIHNLEACMRMNLDSDDGFASPYVWYVYAGNKSYGTYVITDVKVDESIRNVQGQANRATVDVSFQQVSPYQISSGIDITAEAISGGITDEALQGLNNRDPNKGGEAGKQDGAVAGQNGSGNNAGDEPDRPEGTDINSTENLFNP